MTVEYKVVNPATGAIEKKFPTASDAEISSAIARADGIFRTLERYSARRACRCHPSSGRHSCRAGQ